MKPVVLLIGAAVWLTLIGVESLQAAPIPVYQELDPAAVTEAATLFPTRGAVNLSFVAPEIDPNLYLPTAGTVSVTFLSESTRRRNSLGFFTFDSDESILSRGMIFPNGSALGSGGLLTAGDTVTLGQFNAGTNFGFFLIRNGASRRGGPRFYSLDSLNRREERRVAVTSSAIGNYSLYGFEDSSRLRSRSDYNDLVVAVDFEPVPLSGTFDTGVLIPEPGTVLLVISGILAYWLHLIGLNASPRERIPRR